MPSDRDTMPEPPYPGETTFRTSHCFVLGRARGGGHPLYVARGEISAQDVEDDPSSTSFMLNYARLVFHALIRTYIVSHPMGSSYSVVGRFPLEFPALISDVDALRQNRWDTDFHSGWNVLRGVILRSMNTLTRNSGIVQSSQGHRG